MSPPLAPRQPASRRWLRLHRILVVVRKEFRDHLRDRRSVGMALIYPMLGPVLLGGSLYFAGTTLQSKNANTKIHVAAVGSAFAPALTEFLARNNILLKPAPPDPQGAVRRGVEPLVIVFPRTAATEDRYAVTLLVDLSRVGNVKITSRVGSTINGYNREIAAAVSSAAGLPEGFATPVKVLHFSVARDADIAVFFYNLMPPLIVFMIFLSGVYLSIDMTAGERERGQLEPLLIAPVERWELLLAKSLVAIAFTIVIVALNLLAFRGLLFLAAINTGRPVLPPGLDVFAILFLISLPLMAVAVALQMTIAVATRSMKEAQIYLGLLPLVPAMPGMMMVFVPIGPHTWISAVPILGQMKLFDQLIADQSLPAVEIILATASTSLLAAFVFWQAARLFRREKLFFLG